MRQQIVPRSILCLIASLHLGCSDADEPPAVLPAAGAAPASAPQAPPAAPRPAPSASPAAPAAANAVVDEWVRAAGTGSLVLRTRQGGTLTAGVTLATEIELTITGTIARATVRQTFSNPTPDWVEGLYVFPLPDDAAVDHMQVLTDGRIIEGLIQEREEARRTYETAKAEGRRAGLVEQERPNVFATSIANIRPESDVVVEIDYQQSVRLDGGRYSLRVPTVVSRRYLPGSPAGEPSGPTPPSPFEIEVDLAPGFDLDVLESPHHAIDVTDDGVSYRVKLADGPVPGDRDFVLEWAAAAGQEPGAMVFTETLGDDTYALVMLTPPDPGPLASPMRREVVYVIDTSGSMAGASMLQAKRALSLALSRLDPGDRFNVIRFDSVTRALFEEPKRAHPSTVADALDWVGDLGANGGTEFAPAIRLALEDDDPSGRALRQVVFLTDGSVGNEAELLEEIGQALGRSRVFAIGIGAAPNSFFMRKIAQIGRGTFTHIGSPHDVADRMDELFQKLDSALVADVEIVLPQDVDFEMYPYAVPDLYAGEPVVAAIRLHAPLETVTLRGWAGDSPWQTDLDAGLAEDRPGIHVLWARRAIEERMDDRLGTRDPKLLAELRAEVVELARAHHLVSAYTSLVAVDVTPERYPHEALSAHSLGGKLPAGWESDASFGLAQGATPATLHVAIGLLLTGLGLLARRLGP